MNLLTDIREWREVKRFERTAQVGDSRRLTRREERRFSRRLANRYMHRMAPGRSCNRGGRFGYGIRCIRCAWRDLTGRNRRDFRRYVAEFKARADEVEKQMRPTEVEKTPHLGLSCHIDEETP